MTIKDGTFDYHGITIDFDRDKHLSEFSKSLLEPYYLVDGETSPQEAFARAALAYCEGDLEFAQKIYEAASKGWFMFSSPVLSNAPRPGDKWKAMPISCFLTFVPDTLKGLIEHSTELRWLSVMGGGVGGHWSDIRAVSKKAPGPIPFLKTVDADMTAYRQGVVRRGSYAAYLDISHPDILEFLQIRVPTGGDPNRKCFNLHNAINITDEFMNAVINGEKWDLKDPHEFSVRETIDARELLQRIIEVRFRTGEPYLHFIDTSNRHMPEALKKLGLKINGSNLCSEIFLPTSAERTAVCCLSSLNLALYEEWKDTDLVEILIRMLDNVLQVFIDHAPDDISKAKYSAMRERSLGLGTMGFHSYLQSKNIPWEGVMATVANLKIFENIKNKANQETERLAKIKGEYPDGEGTGKRNAHLLAIAPNANSSIILNVSPSIEPWKSNAYTHRTRAGSFLVKNPYLEEIVKTRFEPAKQDEIWNSIVLNNGSIQHLDSFTAYEKQVFKTAFELDQRWVVQHAADRQKFICQGQSVNLFFPAGSDKNYVLATHLKAWKGGLKSLYYLRTSSGITTDKVSQKIERVALKDYVNEGECLSCQG